MTRHIGKLCLKHPELGGLRLTSNSACVSCKNIKTHAYMQSKYKEDLEWRARHLARVGRSRRRVNKSAMYMAHRRAAIDLRVPPWADWGKIEEVYNRARARSLTVDHFFPLRGETVHRRNRPDRRIYINRRSEDMKYRKKPVVIEAIQWMQNGDHPDDHCPPDAGLLEMYPDYDAYVENVEGRIVRRFRHPDVPGHKPCEQCGEPHHIHGWVDTLEQGHRVCPGDFIITGVRGEIYPCKPDIFAATYDKVEE